jgi:hypothetical protein
MAATQANKQWFRYVTNKGVNMSIMADQDWGLNAASGLTAFNATDPPFGPQNRAHHVRKVVYVDPQTFRKRVLPVGTSAADATLPATLAVQVPGETAAITYQMAGLIAEKMRQAGPSRNLLDHT